MNNINSLEDLREVFRRNHVGFPIIMLDGLEVPYLPLENALKELQSLITTHEQQAVVDYLKWTGAKDYQISEELSLYKEFLEENPNA